MALELLHIVTDRSGRASSDERFINRTEVLELLSTPQDSLPTTAWATELKEAFLASVLSDTEVTKVRSGDTSGLADLMQNADTEVDLGAVSRASVVVDDVTYNALIARAQDRAKALLPNVSSPAEAEERGPMGGVGIAPHRHRSQRTGQFGRAVHQQNRSAGAAFNTAGQPPHDGFGNGAQRSLPRICAVGYGSHEG